MDAVILEKEISGYIGRLLRENFGRGPENVFCAISNPYVSVYITNFLSPMEKTLLGNHQSVYVQKTRELMMETLENEITSYIEKNMKEKVKEFYYDWDLDNKTGMFLFVLDHDHSSVQLLHENFKDVLVELENVTKKAERIPSEIRLELLNQRTLLVSKQGTLVSVEKELISLGFSETLKIAKRKLEKRLMNEHKQSLEKLLSASIIDGFVDWNFDQDKSYSLFILKPY